MEVKETVMSRCEQRKLIKSLSVGDRELGAWEEKADGH